MANEVVQDTWSYDPANGIGELGSAQRRRGTSTTPGSNPVTWQETYGYDTSARPSTIATTINEGGSVTLNSGMGYDSQGRPSTHTYPDGLVVQSLYGPYGQSGGLADATSGKIWHETTVEDAWGKPTTEKYADGTVGTIVDYQSSGQEHTASWTLGPSTVDSMTYGYDSFGNLTSQYRAAGSAINTETYGYDQLQRLQSTSRTGGSVSYFYSASGNLTSKSDFGGSYTYAAANSRSNGCGPHAANAADGYSYACDANGNVYGGTTLNITYDADNHPRTASRASAGSVTWAYGVNGGMDYESSSRGIRYFAPGGYEQVGTQGIHELGPIVVTRSNGVDAMTTTLRGRLGSTIDTIDAGFASSANARNYDAFGAARNGDMSVRAYGTLNLSDTIHGFTKHEHADDVWLIHMGGRIYDYQLGRFLSVDPIIQNPLSSQGLNPYSYIGNNPLAGKDPTGYAATQDCPTKNCGLPGVTAADKMDGFTNAVDYYGGNGASSGQSANSVRTVASGSDAGNINTDASARVGGNPASPDSNGGSCKVPTRCDSGAAVANSDAGTSESEYLKNGPYNYWKKVPISGKGFANNRDVADAGQRVNDAPSEVDHDVESTPAQRAFMLRIARPTFDVQQQFRPLTEFFIQGAINQDGSGQIFDPARVSQGGTFTVNPSAQFVAHWHYVGLERRPGPGDDSPGRSWGRPGFVVTPNNQDRCCKIWEVGRQQGRDVYRDIGGKSLGPWQSRSDWNH